MANTSALMTASVGIITKIRRTVYWSISVRFPRRSAAAPRFRGRLAYRVQAWPAQSSNQKVSGR